METISWTSPLQQMLQTTYKSVKMIFATRDGRNGWIVQENKQLTPYLVTMCLDAKHKRRI